MEKSRAWGRTKFAPETITRAVDLLVERAGGAADGLRERAVRTVGFGAESWGHDTDAEFFTDYRRDDVTLGHLFAMHGGYSFRLFLERSDEGDYTRVTIQAPERALIEEVFAVFEDAAPGARLADPPRAEPVIFIGHGRSDQWRDLKDHLHDQHGYQVEAYEVGARAGHGIRDILEAMLKKSSFAVLVLTGEDEDAAGRLHARDNVIHEVGLFQGYLGWPRAIVLLEDGTIEFSNIHGIQQIRFAPGNIRATFGDVLATLRREFGGG